MHNWFLNKVSGLLLVVVLLFAILPVGPLHFIWYGNGTEGQSGGDLAGIVALLGLIIALTVLFIRTAAR